MTQKYFDKFPKISYANNTVVDITRRAAILEKVSQNPYVFYPYNITSNERPDQLSFRYYDDPYASWIVYLTNKMIDPYYEWYLHDHEFENFLTKKYGSFYNARTKIKYYRNNWAESDDITTSNFNALPINLKNYWTPKTINNKIIGYTRKEVDWTLTTNKIVAYVVGDTNFTVDERCEIVFDTFNTGYGQVLKTIPSINTIYLQHVSGSYVESTEAVIQPTSFIRGMESGTNTQFTDTTIHAANIEPTEEAYWKGVTYFDYEQEKNEYNKSIRVLDKTLRDVVVDDLTNIMSS